MIKSLLKKNFFSIFWNENFEAAKDFEQAIKLHAENYTACYYLASVRYYVDMNASSQDLIDLLLKSLESLEKEQAQEKKASIASNIKDSFHKLEDSISSIHNDLVLARNSVNDAIHGRSLQIL